VGLAAGKKTTRTVREEWPAIGVVEIDQRLVEHAAELALDLDLDLRSLDALHLAAALVLPRRGLGDRHWGPQAARRRPCNRVSLIPETAP
jgi:hypothetical protein